MKKKMNDFFRKFGVVALTLMMLITMIPATEYSAADINGPVIESYSLFEDGKTEVKAGDKITLNFSGYDQDSEIDDVYAMVTVKDGDHTMNTSIWSTVTKGEGNNYTAEFMASAHLAGECTITSLRFEDTAGNRTEVSVNYNFTVTLDTDSTTVLNITADTTGVVFDDNNVTGSYKPEMTFTGNTKEITGATITYEVSREGSSYTWTNTFRFYKDYETGKMISYGLEYDMPVESCTYTAIKAVVTYTDGSGAVLTNVPNNVITITNNCTDKTRPEIASIVIDKQGQILESGEVKFTVTATDASPFYEGNKNGYTSLEIEAGADCAEDIKWVDLKHIGNGVFEGTINVDDLYTTNWFVSYVQIYDKYGNQTITPYNEAKKSYFGVKRDGVYIEGTCEDVNFNFYNDWYNENAPFLKLTKNIAHSGVRFADLVGEECFNVAADEELGAFVGWECRNNSEVYTKDTIFYADYDGQNFTFVPRYEKQKYFIRTYEILEDEDGWEYGSLKYETHEYITDKEFTYGEAKKIAGTGKNAYDYKFTGWETDYEELKDDAVVTDDYVYLYATYDKYPVDIEITYVDAAGKPATYKTVKDYAHGTTYQKVFDDAVAAIGASNIPSVKEWYSIYYADYEYLMKQNVGISTKLELIARYDDKNLVECRYNYAGVDEEGTPRRVYEEKFIVVDRATAQDEDKVLALADTAIGTITHWSELTLADDVRYINSYGDFGGQGIYEIYVNYKYKDILLYASTDGDPQVYKVTPGQVVTLATEYDGKQIGWYDEFEDKVFFGAYTIPADAVAGDTFWLYMTTDTNKAVVPESTPEQPIIIQKPAVVLEEEVIAEKVDAITAAIEKATTTGTKEKLVIDMKTTDGKVATQVPKEILEAVKGQDVEIVLDMGGYSWTINGADVKAENLKDINLEVTLNTNSVPSETVKQLAGDDPTYQISLTHEGDFGFKADLSFNIGAENAGKFGNLYYYDSDGRLVFQNAGEIDENGNVGLSFSHASDYVIVISDKEVTEDKPAGPTSPATNDANTMFLMGLFVVSAAVVVLASKKRNTI